MMDGEMERTMTCIRCPVGCRMRAVRTESGVAISGNTCKRGVEYGVQEFLSPMRVVTSSVRVLGGVRPLCSVKTAGDIPKSEIDRVLYGVHGVTVTAPIRIGQVIMEDAAGTGVSLVATSNVSTAFPNP